jgi:hypothetical protein
MKRISDKYAAGIIDGEGCIGLKKRKDHFGYTPYIKVVMTDHIVPELFQHTYGGNLWLRERNDGWKSSTEWVITGKQRTGYFLKFVKRYLIAKRDQADALIKFNEIPAEHKTSKEKQKIQDELYLRLKELKAAIKSPAETK